MKDIQTNNHQRTNTHTHTRHKQTIDSCENIKVMVSNAFLYLKINKEGKFFFYEKNGIN